MDMNWDHLRVFLEVARTGQFLAAGKKLHLDHTTVRRRVMKLEESLSAQLFDRRTDGCRLTAVGERLLETAELLENELSKGCEGLGIDSPTLQGAVRIGAPDGVGTYFLAPRLSSLLALHPELLVQLVPLPWTFSLSKREADIAITVERPTTGRLIARKLVDYGVSLYASEEHIRQFGKIRQLGDLTDRTVITYVEDLAYSRALDYFKLIEAANPKRIECASVVGQVEAIKSGEVVGMVHDHIADSCPDLVRVLPRVHADRSYWLVRHEDFQVPARVTAVCDFLVDLFSHNAKSF